MSTEKCGKLCHAILNKGLETYEKELETGKLGVEKWWRAYVKIKLFACPYFPFGGRW
jgi:hypothetical protein